MNKPWKKISELHPYDDMKGDDTRYIVWNGHEVGEANRKTNYSWYEDADDTISREEWAWSHRSTCGCCWSAMDPQPIAYREMDDAPQLDL